MDEFAEHLFLGEIEFQAQQSIIANNQIDADLRNKDVRAVFAALDDLIDHAARISLILWPSTQNITPEVNKRGQHLRGVLGLSDEHTLKDRRLRGHLVHFDERLDRWVAENPLHYYDRLIGPLDFFVVKDHPPNKLRNFDPETRRYAFQGDEYDIQALVTAVEQVLEAVKQRLA